MNERLEKYRDAGLKAVRFQLKYQREDGAFTWEGFPRDAYHKQVYSWSIAGYLPETHKLLNWIKKNTLQPDGQLRDYRGDVYKLSWFFQGAHRVGRFDLSYPVMSFLMSCQTECGGFPHFASDEWIRSLSTAWAGISAIYFGRLDVAEKAAECCISMLEQQPDPDRFYYLMTRDGKLATPDIHPKPQFVDAKAKGQCYWEVGLPWMLMGRMYQATGERRYLDYAERFFEFKLRCAKDAFSHVGSGKSSLAAAIHYLNTGDQRAKEAALCFADYLLETQYPEGGWRGEHEPDTLLIYIDHAAEYNVWLQEIVGILGGCGV